MEIEHSETTLSRELLKWYDREKRLLPWRTEPSLYRTVVSEFMLQQTQVKTVLPYFERWMQAFPDFETLAGSPEENILRQWEGLGYYRRARNLHRLAKEWTEADSKPESYDEWLQYPGVGPYMAAAISSIAFNETKVVVDGNVIRVICRLKGIDDTFKDSSQATKTVRPLAQAILEPQRPADFNQAIMELGALVCRPRNPQCGVCPWQPHCIALQSEIIESIPNIRKAKSVKITRPRLLVTDPERKCVLLVKDGMQGRLQGMYELPILESNAVNGLEHLSTIKRGISNEMISEPVYRAEPGNYQPFMHKKTEPEWIPFESLGEVTVSGPHRKWLSDFLASGGGSC